MKTELQKGFTIIEVLIAIVACTILLLAAGTVLVSGHAFWNKAWEKANLQRDASRAMLTISRTVKEGMAAQLDNDGKGVTIYKGADSIRFYHPPGTHDLKSEVQGGQSQTIIDGYLENVTFTVQGDLIGIDLRLKRDDLRTDFVSTVMMRNAGG